MGMMQSDLFDTVDEPTPAALREEARFGTWDARCLWCYPNDYSRTLDGARLGAYEAAFRAAQAAMRR